MAERRLIMASFRYAALAVLAVALAFLAVSASPAQTVDLGSLSDNDLKAVVIHLERTRCFGNCPAYVLTIQGDGSVEYLDKEKPGIKDPQKGKIDSGELKALVAEFARVNALTCHRPLLRLLFAEKRTGYAMTTDVDVRPKNCLNWKKPSTRP
jgi:hypothetical protein